MADDKNYDLPLYAHSSEFMPFTGDLQELQGSIDVSTNFQSFESSESPYTQKQFSDTSEPSTSFEANVVPPQRQYTLNCSSISQDTITRHKIHITKEDIFIVEQLIDRMNEIYEYEPKKDVRNKEVLKFCTPADDKVEISAQHSFYISEEIMNYIIQQYKKKKSDWRVLVRETLLHIYGSDIIHYSQTDKTKPAIVDNIYYGLLEWVEILISPAKIKRHIYNKYIRNLITRTRRSEKRKRKSKEENIIKSDKDQDVEKEKRSSEEEGEKEDAECVPDPSKPSTSSAPYQSFPEKQHTPKLSTLSSWTITKEDIDAVKRLLGIMKTAHKNQTTRDVVLDKKNLLKTGYYNTPAANKVEISEKCCFYITKWKKDYLAMTYIKTNNWKALVRETLLDVYDSDITEYVALGRCKKIQKKVINWNLYYGLFAWVNELTSPTKIRTSQYRKCISNLSYFTKKKKNKKQPKI